MLLILCTIILLTIYYLISCDLISHRYIPEQRYGEQVDKKTPIIMQKTRTITTIILKSSLKKVLGNKDFEVKILTLKHHGIGKMPKCCNMGITCIFKLKSLTVKISVYSHWLQWALIQLTSSLANVLVVRIIS